MTFMKNFRLKILLESSPLSEGDKRNIEIIFSVLSPSRQIQVLDGWDGYIERLIRSQRSAEQDYEERLRATITQAEALLDESELREKELNEAAEKRKKQTRAELESTVAYDQLQRLQKIKQIQTPTH